MALSSARLFSAVSIASGMLNRGAPAMRVTISRATETGLGI